MVKKILCMLVAIVLCFGLFAGCTEQEIIEEETDAMVSFSMPEWHLFQAGTGSVILEHSEDAIFECTIDIGQLHCNMIYKKSAIVKYDHSLGEEQKNYFQISPYEENSWGCSDNGYYTNQSFIEIILKVDGRITGYAVVSFYRMDYSLSFNTVLIKSALFPKVNEKYQKISKSQVKKTYERN